MIPAVLQPATGRGGGGMQARQEDGEASHGHIQDSAASIPSVLPRTRLRDHRGGGPPQHVYPE